jgi:recombination associated protein RdgC
MFKQLSIFLLASMPQNVGTDPTDELGFVPTQSTEQFSVGWLALDEFGFAHDAGKGHVIMKARIEKRTVPGATLKAAVDKKCAAYERESGRKAGKGLKKDYKDAALIELLPRAFPKTKDVPVWIDTRKARVVIGSTSAGDVDAVVSLLVQTFDGLEVRLLNTVMAPATLMSCWLSDGQPDVDEFNIDRACQLEDPSEMRSTVRYARAPLDTEEVKAYLRAGMRATKLELDWRGRVAFTLTDSMQIKGVEILDIVLDDHQGDEDQFDADVAITIGELGPMIDSLVAAMGGLQS